jgi:CheY-like chemotaxis protein
MPRSSSCAQILIADPHRPARTKLAETLRGCGYTVREVESFDQVIFALGTTPFDLAIIDAELPPCDRLESVRIISNASTLPVLTTSSDEECQREAVAAGAKACIRKPFKSFRACGQVRAALRPRAGVR